MGTYTSNYNLYMPTVGETGWGTLVNGNFTIIDTTMKGLNTRADELESRIEGVEEVTSIIEVDENKNVTFPGVVSARGGINLNVVLTTESGIISGVWLSTRVALVSVVENVNSATYTYRPNPIYNTVIFSAVLHGAGTAGYGIVKINDIVILNHSTHSLNQTFNTEPIELKDGDIIYVEVYCPMRNSTSTISMVCEGYLING